jgi:hypothetical protein
LLRKVVALLAEPFDLLTMQRTFILRSAQLLLNPLQLQIPFCQLSFKGVNLCRKGPDLLRLLVSHAAAFLVRRCKQRHVMCSRQLPVELHLLQRIRCVYQLRAELLNLCKQGLLRLSSSPLLPFQLGMQLVDWVFVLFTPENRVLQSRGDLRSQVLLSHITHVHIELIPRSLQLALELSDF